MTITDTADVAGVRRRWPGAARADVRSFVVATQPRIAVDRCPGALRMHEAADGFLARVRLPGGRITGAQLAGLGAIAADLGAGFLELTSRANVQLRALPAECDAAERIADLGLLPSLTHERVRNIAAGPDPSFDETITELDAALCARPALADLPGRFLFGVGPARDADVLIDEGRVIAQGRAITGGVTTALDLAERFLAVRDGRWRVAELPEPLLDGPVVDPLPVPDPGGAVAPLGRLTTAQTRALAGAGTLVITTARTVVVRGADAAGLAAAGLVTDPASPWRGVTACVGMPRCAKALADVRADAASNLGAHPGRRVHWAGCDRACGRTSDVEVTMIATGAGYVETGYMETGYVETSDMENRRA